MKSIYGKILCFLFLTLIGSKVYAAHLVGSEASYTCLGGGVYNLKFSLYMEPANLTTQDPDMVVHILDLDDPNADKDNLYMQLEIDRSGADTVYNYYENKCTGDSWDDEMYIWTYEQQVTLPANTNGYKIYYWRCCRPDNLENVPDDLGVAIELDIPGNAAAACNNSPVFGSDPVKLLCADEEIDIDLSATDADGDSLVYALEAPLAAGTPFNPSDYAWWWLGFGAEYDPPFDPVTYNAGFSETNPFGDNSVTLGSDGHLTGKITTTGDYFVVGVTVYEYRDGVLIGKVRRDVPVVVVDCDRVVARVEDSILVNSIYCTQTVSFTNSSITATEATWDFGEPGAGDVSTDFNPTHTYSDTGSFVVTLIASHPSYPNCYDTTTTNVKIAKDITADFDYTTSCGSNTVVFNNTSDTNALVNTTHNWEFTGSDNSAQSNDSFTFSNSGNYNVLLSISDENGCTDSITQTIEVGANNASVTLTPQQDSICELDSNVYTATGGTDYAFYINDSLAYSGVGNYIAPYLSEGDSITVISDPSGNCKDTAYHIIKTYDNPSISFTANGICTGDAASITASGPDITSMEWQHTASNALTVNFNAGDVTDTTTYYGTAISSKGCRTLDSVILNVHSLPTIEAGDDQTICAGSSTNLDGQVLSNHTISAWNWDNADNVQSPTVSPGVATTYTLTATDNNGCSNTDNVTVSIGQYKPSITQDTVEVCFGDDATVSIASGSNFSWKLNANIGSEVSTTDSYTYTPTTSEFIELTASDNSGVCSGKDTVQIVVNALPTLSMAAANICKAEEANIVVSSNDVVSMNWQHTGATNALSITIPAGVLLDTTMYYGTGVSAEGCAKLDSVAVNVLPLPIISAGTDQTICTGSNTSVTASNDANFTITNWAWDNGMNGKSISISPSSNTRYTVTATDNNNCKDTSSVLIHIDSFKPEVNNDAINICEGDSISISSTNGKNFSWKDEDGTIIAAMQSTIVKPTTSTYYILEAQDTQSPNCSGKDTVNVTVNAAPAFSMTADSICFGDDASIDVTGNDISNISWNHSSETSNSITIDANDITSSTTYYATITASTNCSNSDSILVKVIPLPIVDAGTDQSICAAGSTTLTPSIGNNKTIISWNWDNTNNVENPDVSPANTTRYTLTATDNKGCSDTSSVLVTIDDFKPSLREDKLSVCNGIDTSIAALTGMNFDWTDEAGNPVSSSNSYSFTPNTSTYFIVSATDNSGNCSGKDTVFVTVNDNPTMSLSGPAICAGEATFLSASGTNIANVTWQHTSDEGQNLNLAAGEIMDTTTFYATAISDSNCTTLDSITINVHALPIVSAGADFSICEGTSTSLSPSTGMNTNVSTWDWDNDLDDIETPSITPIENTRYTLTVTDNNNCSDTSSVFVTIEDFKPELTSNELAICEGSSGQITASIATNPVWTDEDGNQLSTDLIYSFTPDEDGLIILTALDQSGNCEGKDTASITIEPLPTIELSGEDICLGESVSITSSGTDIDHIEWDQSNSTDLNLFFASGEIDETTTFNATAVSNEGCRKDTFIEITVHPIPDVNAGQAATICSGTDYDLNGTVSSNFNIVTWNWDNADNVQSPTINPTQETDYILTATDDNGCENTASVTISVLSYTPEINEDTVTLCSDESTTIRVSSGTNFVWTDSSGNVLSTNSYHNFSPENSTYVTLTADHHVHGCSGSDTVYIRMNSLLEVELEDSFSICSDEELQLKGQDTRGQEQWYIQKYGSIYQVGLNDVVIYIEGTENEQKDTYIFMVEDHLCGTTTYDTVEVNNASYEIEQLEVDKDPTDQENEYFFFVPKQPDSTYVEWFVNGDYHSREDEFRHQFLRSGSYTVYADVTNDQSCMHTISTEVTIEVPTTLYVPNAFAPNADPETGNHLFRPIGLFEDIDVYTMEIYTRSGRLVFRTEDIEEGWNGYDPETTEHSPQMKYVYKITYQIDPQSKPVHKTGFLLLLW